MTNLKYQQIRAIVFLFVFVLIALAIRLDNFFLAFASLTSGLLFMTIAHSSKLNSADEREVTVQHAAANTTYGLVTSTLGLTTILLLLPSKGGFSIFAKGQWIFLEAVGMLLAFLSLLIIVIYTLSYQFYTQKYGGRSND